jgi:hypothetical protein
VALVAAYSNRAARPAPTAWALGVLAGLAYGGASIGARILHHPGTLVGLVSDPATWGMVGSGIVGLFLYATAVQRGRVTTVTAAVVVAETLVPAGLGVLFLGDHPRHGFASVAAAGFVLTVFGALNLARHGEVDSAEKAAHQVRVPHHV